MNVFHLSLLLLYFLTRCHRIAPQKTKIHFFTCRAWGRTGAVASRPGVDEFKAAEAIEVALESQISGCVPSRPLHSTTTMSPVELPTLLWTWYIEHLWNYKPGSWVDTSASTFRFLAAFIIMPLALLVMFASPSLPHPSSPQPEALISSPPILPSLVFRFVALTHARAPGSSSFFIWVHVGRDVVHHRTDARNHRRHEGFYE